MFIAVVPQFESRMRTGHLLSLEPNSRGGGDHLGSVGRPDAEPAQSADLGQFQAGWTRRVGKVEAAALLTAQSAIDANR